MEHRSFVKTVLNRDDAYLLMDQLIRENRDLPIVEASIVYVNGAWRVGLIVGSTQYDLFEENED